MAPTTTQNGCRPGQCQCSYDDARDGRCENGGTMYGSGVVYHLAQNNNATSEHCKTSSDLVGGQGDTEDSESLCFTSQRQKISNQQLSKPLRKFYKEQNSLIDAYENMLSMPEDMSDDDEDNKTMKMASFWSKVTFVANVALLLAKIVAAAISGSLVVISSMLDSAMDLVSGALMWWSNRAIKKTNYYFYPRGRRKLEPVAIVVLAVIMSFVSVQVIQESIQKIVIYATHIYDDELVAVNSWLRDARAIEDNNLTSLVDNGCPTWNISMSSTIDLVSELETTLITCASQHGAPVFELPTILICVITIVVKLILYLICRRIQNHSVQALAKDHFNDVISNSGAVACGIIGYRLWKYADPLGAIIISVSIIINWSITAHSQIKMLTGYTAQPHFLKKITWIALRHDDRIRCIERVIAFHFGSRYLVEVHIVLPAEMSMREAHDLSEALQAKIERLGDVERAFVHTDYESCWHNDEAGVCLNTVDDETPSNATCVALPTQTKESHS